jgi:hypothetical protein
MMSFEKEKKRNLSIIFLLLDGTYLLSEHSQKDFGFHWLPFDVLCVDIYIRQHIEIYTFH